MAQACTRLAVSIFISLLAAATAAGDLTPPGAPEAGPSVAEPRIPIISLPASLEEPGSYYLIDDLRGVAFDAGIRIAASDITIDLNGFRLQGILNSGPAIVSSVGQTNVAVRNGTITGWGGNGIGFLNVRNAVLEDLTLEANGGWGAEVGEGALVLNCSAIDNVDGGFRMGLPAMAIGCLAEDNAGPGFDARGFGADSGGPTVLRGCRTFNNEGPNIAAGDAALLTDCVSTLSDDSGVITGEGSLIRDSVISSNFIDGARVGAGTMITESALRFNGGPLSDGAAVRVRGDGVLAADLTVTDNFIGFTSGSATNRPVIIRNWLGGNTDDFATINSFNIGPSESPVSGTSAHANFRTAPLSTGSAP